ncbi:hypothetical protein Tco_0641022 [Tanacetum coccineum]
MTGWTTGTDYQAWADDKVFKVGDSLGKEQTSGIIKLDGLSENLEGELASQGVDDAFQSCHGSRCDADELKTGGWDEGVTVVRPIWLLLFGDL